MNDVEISLLFPGDIVYEYLVSDIMYYVFCLVYCVCLNTYLSDVISSDYNIPKGMLVMVMLV